MAKHLSENQIFARTLFVAGSTAGNWLMLRYGFDWSPAAATVESVVWGLVLAFLLAWAEGREDAS